MRTWRIAAGAAAGVLALTAASAPAISSAAGGARPASPAACGAINDVYQSATSLLRSCGYTVYPLRKVIKNSDGSTTYVYDIAGHRVTSVRPPADFDPLKATNQQLKEFGLPTRAMLGAKAWRKLMSHLSYSVPRRFLVAGTSAMRFSNCKTCWAGYQDQNHSNYFEALASYNEPRIKSVSCSKPVQEGIWVGVGDEKSTIGQAGTTAGTSHDHQSFWEIIGPGFDAPPIYGKTAKPGDKITSFTTYPSGEGAYTFTVMDKSKMILQANVLTSIYQGNFALFVVEDPARGKTNPHIPNFGRVTFTNAQAARVNGPLSKIGKFPHKALKMVDPSGHTLANAGSLSGNNKFPVTYSRCS